jgi:predicted amino acid racemase
MAKLIINLDKIIQNFRLVKKICQDNHIELVVVTKCCCGDNKIIQALIDAGADIIAESQSQNFSIIGKPIKKMLLHSSLSALENDFTCDFIFISELEILKKYSQSSLAKQAAVIIPLEMGDMRDGVLPEELVYFLNKALVENVQIAGFSANFGCFQAKEPKVDWFNNFIQCVEKVEYQCGFKPALLSIGGTSIWSLFYNNLLPKKINPLRIGEGIFFGYDPALKQEIPSLSQETFKLKGEILEIKNKKDHEGQDNEFRQRAIIDFGYASTLTNGLRSTQEGVEIIGSSQDITVIDITNANTSISIGDHLEFSLRYESLVRAMISPYIEKLYVYDDRNVSQQKGCRSIQSSITEPPTETVFTPQTHSVFDFLDENVQHLFRDRNRSGNGR